MGRSRYIQLVLIGLLLAFVTGRTDISRADGVCPNEALRVGLSASLPDCRAYEQVTPVDKSLAVQDLDTTGMEAISAVDGERFALKTLVPFGSTPMLNGSMSVFSRTSEGWQMEPIAPSNLGSKVFAYPVFSRSLTQVGFAVESLEEPPVGQTLQVGATGNPYATIAVASSTGAGESYVAGATPDFGHVFFASTNHALLSTAPTGTAGSAHDLYEWSGGGECGSVTSDCALVNVHSDGSLVGECGAKLQGVSADGTRVVFQSPDPEAFSSSPSCLQPFGLYMRIAEIVEGHTEARTEEISKPNEGVVERTGSHPVYFASASADATRVFFITATELTEDDEGVPGAQLYEYNANAKMGSRLTRISDSKTGPVEIEGETTKGYVESVFTSNDGSRIYFITGGNIYRYNTMQKELHPVAQTEGTGTGGSGAGRYNEITPDGNFFTFVTLHLSGFPVADPKKYDEVYRYDDETGTIICVSCSLNGAQPTGDSQFRTQAGILEAAEPTPKFTAISEDGSYVFFESTQGLVNKAVNVSGGYFERNNTDVYEWHNGVIALISSPIDQRPQKLLGASADGSNVFFLTHAQLVPQDTDTSADIYDARVGGGFSTSTESAACLDDTCQSVPLAPVRPALGTSVANGSGNLVPVPAKVKVVCAKGKVRRRGRCVRKETRRLRRSARRAAGYGRRGLR